MSKYHKLLKTVRKFAYVSTQNKLIEMHPKHYETLTTVQREKVAELQNEGFCLQTYVYDPNSDNPKKRRRTKWDLANIKQEFLIDFATGKYTVKFLSTKYNIDRRLLDELKRKHFGTGNQRMIVMQRMKNANVPTRAIAEYFNTPNSSVSVVLGRYNKRLTNKSNMR